MIYGRPLENTDYYITVHNVYLLSSYTAEKKDNTGQSLDWLFTYSSL